jgi:hypothetical protein
LAIVFFRSPLNGEVKKKHAIPGEVKHLSNRRKRKRIDSVSSGERKRNSPNRELAPGVVGPRRGTSKDRTRRWKAPAERVKPPYPKSGEALGSS